MRVAYLVDSFPPLSETFILNQITGLMDLGHEVDVFAQIVLPRGPFHPGVLDHGLLDRAFPLAPPDGKWDRLAMLPGLLARGLGWNPSVALRALDPRRFGRRALSLRSLFQTVPFLDPGRRYDVVHCHYGSNGLRAVELMAIGALECPVVVTFHGYDLRLARERGPEWLRPLRGRVSSIIAISRWSRDRLVELEVDPNQIVVHPVGIDLGDFEPGPRRPDAASGSAEPVRVLTVARLVPEKGLDVGVRAFAELRARLGPGRVRWEIAGAGPEEGPLRVMISELGLTDAVSLTGGMTGPAIRDRLAEADLFCLPSRDEITPTVLLEAQAMGLPVLATDVGAVSEIVQDGVSGVLVPSGDAPALALALERLLEARDRWVPMGEAGRRFVAEYHNISVLNGRLVSIFEGIRK